MLLLCLYSAWHSGTFRYYDCTSIRCRWNASICAAVKLTCSSPTKLEEQIFHLILLQQVKQKCVIELVCLQCEWGMVCTQMPCLACYTYLGGWRAPFCLWETIVVCGWRLLTQPAVRLNFCFLDTVRLSSLDMGDGGVNHFLETVIHE